MNIAFRFLALPIVGTTLAADFQSLEVPPLWDPAAKLAEAKELPALERVRFSVIKRYEPEVDGYRFLHGVALAWHKGRLYASFGHNKGGENTDTEEARVCWSEDDGRTWSAPVTIDAGVEPGIGVSHGVFLSRGGELWAFHGAYSGTLQHVHTRAYLRNDADGSWQSKGTVIDGGFWPLGEPASTAGGNWIMAGLRVGDRNPAAVAISHGEDLTKWDLVVIPLAPGLTNAWGESALIVDGTNMTSIARYGGKAVALVARSADGGRTWSTMDESNLPMTTSKPCAGTLSTGERFLVGTTAANNTGRRHPLTIALGEPGASAFNRVFVIRAAEFPAGPGESHPKAALAYPCATEHDGKLYVGYSNSGGGAGRQGTGRALANNNSAELAVIPLDSLRHVDTGLAAGPMSAEAGRLAFRSGERTEVTPTNEIVDGHWIVIGNSDKAGGHVTRDADHPHKGSPVYRFVADTQGVRRIEFSELFGSLETLRGLPREQIDRLVAVKATDVGTDHGRYGDTVTYAWSTRFPERMGPETLGIFAQWHGRPDRTLVEDEHGVRMLLLPDFEALCRTVTFDGKDGWGLDKSSGARTAWRVDAAAGGPIGEFRVGFDHLYLMVRSDASRRSSPDDKLKTKPTNDVGYRAVEGTKEAALVWKMPLADVSVGEWMDFKVRIRYAEYDPNADRVLEPGAVTLWVNGRQVADWKGNIGQNDTQGPYFKFGIYVPGPGGFKVDHAAYQRTIERTRRTPEIPNPVLEEMKKHGLIAAMGLE